MYIHTSLISSQFKVDNYLSGATLLNLIVINSQHMLAEKINVNACSVCVHRKLIPQIRIKYIYQKKFFISTCRNVLHKIYICM